MTTQQPKPDLAAEIVAAILEERPNIRFRIAPDELESRVRNFLACLEAGAELAGMIQPQPDNRL